jgi:quercetin dioxygenase-like cupin family protein
MFKRAAVIVATIAFLGGCAPQEAPEGASERVAGGAPSASLGKQTAAAAEKAPPAEMKLEELFKTALSDKFTPGREVIVSLVEIPPNATLESHWHPGEEFVYMLEGEARIEIEGHEPFVGKAGMVGHMPFMTKHTAVAGENGARALVFRVHTAGQPVRYLEGGGSGKK